MKKNQTLMIRLTALVMTLALVAVAPLGVIAQTRIEAPRNRYSVSDDVKLGQQAAQQAEQQLPILNDRYATDYLTTIGRRLVSAIPGEFAHPEFRYSFKLVNANELNAFALPGGFTYVNRGLINAARNEGELAGVMAHEIAHVALRHGTANASKAASPKAQLPAIGGAILGAILGGTAGGIAQTAGQIGSTAIVTKYGREAETQADILGAQIMARAGYNPRDLANMFRTIQSQSGGRGGVEFLSTHPDPGNRYERISREAELLRVDNRTQNSAEFERLKSYLRGQPNARANNRNGNGTTPRGSRGTYTGRVEYPSSRFRTYSGGNLFRISVPENWRDAGAEGQVALFPEGGVSEYEGREEFTHGTLLGVAQSQSRDLQQATDEYVRGLLQSNPNLRQQTRYQRGTIDRRQALTATLSGRSNVTGDNEYVTIYTTLLQNGDLFYMIAIAPESDYRAYQNVFANMIRSLQING
jgi:hypothetical protein